MGLRRPPRTASPARPARSGWPAPAPAALQRARAAYALCIPRTLWLTARRRAQVIHQVAILKRRLEFPDDAPRSLRALAERCMAIDPGQRSTFDQVKRELAQLRGALPAF